MYNKFFFFTCFMNWTSQLHRLHQQMEHWHMTKYLSHYHLCLMVEEYLLNETQGKVYASVVFVPLLHSVSSTLMTMMYSIISLLNISFVNRSCMIKKLSVWTRDAKWKWRYLEMLCTVKPGMLYAKSHKNVTLYCWFTLILSEYNYIHFTAGLMYWTWTARRSVDNHFNDNSTQKEQQLLTDALCLVCEYVPQIRSSQLHKILPTPLTKMFPGTRCATQCLQAYSPLYSSVFPINKIPQR